jgi:A/G-specific adenine glycosylase
MNYSEFTETVWDYYAKQSRDLPWRHPDENGEFDPYKILVSEIMLQQTQVSRVVDKYTAWFTRFPTLNSLAHASLADVLTEWVGLGYNRRAKYLHQIAQAIYFDKNGIFPKQIDELIALPGIGHNTAAAILAYSFNMPTVFVETNIRTVYIYHFFSDKNNISDKQLLEVISNSLDKENPREWYWALMDYGSYLKRTVGNISKQSQHYKKQTTFNGSKRQIRSKIIKQLSEKSVPVTQILNIKTNHNTEMILNELVNEGLVQITQGTVSLPHEKPKNVKI